MKKFLICILESLLLLSTMTTGAFADSKIVFNDNYKDYAVISKDILKNALDINVKYKSDKPIKLYIDAYSDKRDHKAATNNLDFLCKIKNLGKYTFGFSDEKGNWTYRDFSLKPAKPTEIKITANKNSAVISTQECTPYIHGPYIVVKYFPVNSNIKKVGKKIIKTGRIAKVSDLIYGKEYKFVLTGYTSHPADFNKSDVKSDSITKKIRIANGKKKIIKKSITKDLNIIGTWKLKKMYVNGKTINAEEKNVNLIIRITENGKVLYKMDQFNQTAFWTIKNGNYYIQDSKKNFTHNITINSDDLLLLKSIKGNFTEYYKRIR